MLIEYKKIIKNIFDIILHIFRMIKNVKLFNFEIFLKTNVKIVDEISSSIKIDYNNIYFLIENSYIIELLIEFF